MKIFIQDIVGYEVFAELIIKRPVSWNVMLYSRQKFTDVSYERAATIFKVEK
jgi:hypothetical protein